MQLRNYFFKHLIENRSNTDADNPMYQSELEANT